MKERSKAAHTAIGLTDLREALDARAKAAEEEPAPEAPTPTQEQPPGRRRPWREKVEAVARKWTRGEPLPKVLGNLEDPTRPVLPMEVGAAKALAARYPEGHERALRELLKMWCRSRDYVRAIALEGSMRHDVDGNATGPVDEEHRAHATKQLRVRISAQARRKP